MGLGAAAGIVGAIVRLHASRYHRGEKRRRSGGDSALSGASIPLFPPRVSIAPRLVSIFAQHRRDAD
jgi:hypothetical protein